MTPLISIIIPTYNRAHLIGETFDSIIDQTYTNWECIVVDDGSTDNTAAVVAKYIENDNRFQYHQRPNVHKPGGNGARNYGYLMSKGQYIKWCDSDDILLPSCIEKQLQKLKYLDVSVCQVLKYDFESQKKLGITQINSPKLIEDYLVGRVTFYICGPIWSRVFIEKQTELFDESISNLDDWDFNLRMLYQNPKICFIHEAFIHYRVHSLSLSQELGKLNKKEIISEIKTRDKHIELLKNNKLVDTIVLRNFTKNRIKLFLREAMLKKDQNSFYYYYELSKRQFELFDVVGWLKCSLAFVSYKFFGKGYKLLK